MKIAETFLQLEARDSAQLYLEHIIAKDPQYAQGYLKLSMFYLLEGQKQVAEDVLTTGLNIITDPKDKAQLSTALKRFRE